MALFVVPPQSARILDLQPGLGGPWEEGGRAGRRRAALERATAPLAVVSTDVRRRWASRASLTPSASSLANRTPTRIGHRVRPTPRRCYARLSRRPRWPAASAIP